MNIDPTMFDQESINQILTNLGDDAEKGTKILVFLEKLKNLLNGIGKKHGQVGKPSSGTEKESIDAATPDVDRHAGEPDAGSSQRDDRSDEESMGELAETVRIQQEVLVETVELIEQIANRQQSLTRNLQAAIDMFDRQAAFNKQIMDTFAQQTDINKRLTELHTSR